jgi:hypothetical protein
LAKLIGPTATEVEVGAGAKGTVTAAAGRYAIKVRYGPPANYRYTQGDEFIVTESSTTRSETMITLHKVVDGNYNSRPITQDEFNAPLRPESQAQALLLLKRELTTKEGAHLPATILNYHEGTLTFRNESSGARSSMRLAQFSEADQKYISQMSEQGKFGPPLVPKRQQELWDWVLATSKVANVYEQTGDTVNAHGYKYIILLQNPIPTTEVVKRYGQPESIEAHARRMRNNSAPLALQFDESFVYGNVMLLKDPKIEAFDEIRGSFPAPAGVATEDIKPSQGRTLEKEAEGNEKTAVAAEYPCALTLVEIKIVDGTALASLDIQWAKEVPDLKQKDMTVVILFQPKLIFPLRAELLAVGRDVLINVLQDGLMKMTSGLVIKDDKGNSR